MSSRGGCFCGRKSLAVHSSKSSSCSKPISTLKKESSNKPSSVNYRGGGSCYSKPSAPQNKITSRSKPANKTNNVLLSKPGSVAVPSRRSGSSNAKPPTAQSKASSCRKPNGKTKSSSATTGCCGSELCNTKPFAPLSKTPSYSSSIEKTEEPSTKPSSIASESNPTKSCNESQNITKSPPSMKPKNLTKSSVVVKITVRTPQTTIEQETTFDIDS
ncbi:Protein of unknown function [Gryllus bimaculatus]|nr:Protein of unknown function [Gryllus bimaculatus]